MKKEVLSPRKVGDYFLVNHEKLDRVIVGVVGREGRVEGGLGSDAAFDAVLAGYDKLGGLILDAHGNKIATGSFYDFQNKRARVLAEPEVAEQPKAKLKVDVSEVEKKRGRRKKLIEE